MKKILFFAVTAALLAFPLASVSAQSCTFGSSSKSFSDSFKCVFKIGETSGINVKQSPVEFILSLIRFGLGLSAVLALVFVIYAGARYIMSRGEESETEKAKKGLFYALLGLLIIGVSLILVNTVIGALKGEAIDGGGGGGGEAGGQRLPRPPAGGGGGGGGGAGLPPNPPAR